ncbi:MAG TPA: type II toxin-antitoxin system Phd/YefM family antitoxin [Casimicrobiaceae bacterium]|nr:type II toxin-antitoxin system Phd/YefM family antitoxin [Casimicrobiaceae bacterium]
MDTFNIHEAKTHLSRLIEEVSGGAEIVIAKAGKPVAKLVPIDPIRPVRKPGFLKGKIRIPADFDAPLPDWLLDAFEGKK